MSTEVLRIKVPMELASECVVSRPAQGEAKRVFLLLHGYSQMGAYPYRRCAEVLPRDSIIISPNALFPVARSKTNEAGEKRFALGYSWYFYDPFTDEYAIGKEPALEYLENLLTTLKVPRDLPMTLIGFSQGGYLAPFVAAHFETVDHVIGVAARVLHEEIIGTPLLETLRARVRIDGIHGARDTVVPAPESQRAHAVLAAQGVRGEFLLLPETEHRMDEAVRAAIKALLVKSDA